MVNWRVHRVLAYCTLALIAAAFVGLFGIRLEDKVIGIPWKFILFGGVGYLAWAFNKMLHF